MNPWETRIAGYNVARFSSGGPADREIHENAWRLRQRRFYLPQHQSLRSKDILNGIWAIWNK